MEKRYKIHEVADILGIAPSAIRFYEKKGFFRLERMRTMAIVTMNRTISTRYGALFTIVLSI